MSHPEDDTTLRLRVLYEANQAVGQAITDIRKLKEETGGLSVENQKTLEVLEKQHHALDLAEQDLKKGSLSYAELKQEVAALDAQLKTLRQSFKDGSIDLGQFQDASSELTGALREKRTALAAADGTTRKLGNGVLQTSYAVQDFTSQLGTRGLAGALGAVQNNIPVILSSLGVGAGLAGAISLVSVGIGALLPMLTQFIDLEDKAAEATKKHKEEADKLAGRLTSDQEAVKKQVDDYTKDTPTVRQAIEAATVQEARHGEIDPGELESVAMGLPYVQGQDTHKEAAKVIRARREAKAREDAARLFATLGTDTSARAQVAELSRKHGGFPAGIADFLSSVEETPEQQARAEAEIEENDPDEQYMRRHHAARDRRNAEAEKSNADLAKQKAEKAAAARESRERNEYNRQLDEANGEDPASIKRAEAQRVAYNRQVEREDASVARAAERDRKQADRDATKAAHDADPRVANRRAIQAEQSQALNAVQQNTHGFNAPQQHEIARHLEESYNAGAGMSHTFQQILADAIRQTQEHYNRGVASGLHRQQQNSMSFYQP